MRAPLSWIREFTPVDAPVADLVAALNQLGLEVESVEQPGEEITGVVAGRVLDVVKHPDADKLSLVDVDFGAGQTRVVCGAPNVVAGMVAPVRAGGCDAAGRVHARTAQDSRAWCPTACSCRRRELGPRRRSLGDRESRPRQPRSEPTSARSSASTTSIFDLSITPNRPDAMCIVGVARELAAHFKLELNVREPKARTDAADRERHHRGDRGA